MRHRSRLVSALAIGIVFLASGFAARAQGILVPRRPDRIQPFYVKNLRVNTTITDAVAETTVEQTFVNSSGAEQEGTYLYPLPEGAAPTAFSMTVGDRTLEPRILGKDEARSIYEGIVRRRRDPALLEYVGRNLVRVSVYPIPAHGERTIRMRYSEVLKPEGGMRKYAYPISTSRFGNRPVGTATVSIKLRTSAPLKNVYSPTHDLSIRRPDEHSATAAWESRNDASDRDLALFFSTDNDDIGLSLLTYRTGARDGYFMLLAAPRVAIPKARALPKQVVFVLDRTGSMSGEKIKQARNALLFCLDHLHPQDRFGLITFNESADMLTQRLEPATEANVARAKRHVCEIEASGGTNIDEGLRTALNLLRDEAGRQKMVVFLTDGLPTVGETNVETILKHVQDLNGGRFLAQSDIETRPRLVRAGQRERDGDEKRPRDPERGANARIFSFGVGYDVNVPFLDRLANLGRGDTDYVKPSEDIEVKVSDFYAKISSPVLSNLKLAFDGADVYDIYPKTLPDLFKGSQLVIVGRFRGEGGGTVRLAGLANGERETFRIGTGFRETDARHSFLPRIWAARKIGYLADQLRLASASSGRQELIDEIVRLSKDFGIITEYTSFLVDEREQRRLGLRAENGFVDFFAADNSVILRRELAQRARRFGESGEDAANQSLRAKDYQRADKAASRYQNSTGSLYSLEGLEEKEGIAAAPGNFQAGGGVGGLGGRGRGANNSLALGTRGPAGSAKPADTAVTVQAIQDRAFYRQKNNVWQDNSYDAKKHALTKVQAFSDAHFALLKAVPELAAYSSAGDEVIVRLGKNAVQIGKEGKEKLTAAELKMLSGR